MNMYSCAPFDGEEFIFELKLDGARCLAFVGGGSTDFISRNGRSFLLEFPELLELEKDIGGRVILDGELVVACEGRSSFSAFQKRMVKKDAAKIARAAEATPAEFVAFDILYADGKNLTNLPLIERKQILEKRVGQCPSVTLSRYIEQNGKAFFELTQQQNLEGIVAKQKQSPYLMAKRTRYWLKIKNPNYKRPTQ